jgi:filamentous hemagglutinin family protein
MLNHTRTLLLLGTVFLSLSSGSTYAQSIIRDGSLGSRRGLSGPNYTILQEDGRTVGSSLFQSFERFNLNVGESATFESSGNIRTIFSRVTGIGPSRIDGLIRTQSSNVDLFFINPRGIFFGENAGLDVGGSFIASTADSIVFSIDDRPFSAVQPQDVPRLSISTPIGLQVGQRPGIISNASVRLDSVNGFLPLGLEVPVGHTLGLIGGEIRLNGGALTAASGRIELGGVSNSLVGLSQAFNGWAFDYTDVPRLQDITLRNQAVVSTSTPFPDFDPVTGQLIFSTLPPGIIRIQGASVLLQGESRVSSLNGEEGFGGGTVSIDAQDLILQDGSNITVDNFGVGSSAGNILINADFIRLSEASLEAGQNSAGVGGNINIVDANLLLLDNSDIATNAVENSRGGNVSINSDFIVAFPNEDSDITANAENGPGGQIAITTQGLFGLEVRDMRTDFSSDITAISINDPSLNGQVTINTPETDPSDSTTELSERIDIPPKLAQSCRPGQALGNGQFANVGSGGLPSNPDSLRSYPAVWHDMRPLAELQQASTNLILPRFTPTPDAAPIIEAKGWVTTDEGLMLVSEKPSLTALLTASGTC